MPKPKARARRRASLPSAGEWLALPTLVTLLAGMLVLGMFLSFFLALLAAFVAGLAGWLWWRRASHKHAARRRTRRPDR